MNPTSDNPRDEHPAAAAESPRHPGPAESETPAAATAAPASPIAKPSFWALVLAAVGVGFLFYRIIEPFFAPLFFAVVLAVLFRPLHIRIASLLGGHRRSAAVATVLLIFLVLLGLSSVLLFAARELAVASENFSKLESKRGEILHSLSLLANDYLPGIRWTQFREWFNAGFESLASTILEKTGQFLSNALQVVVGIAIMTVSVYYFLAEGPAMARALRNISPFSPRDEWLLFERFAVISRGVMVGIFVCALVQAVLLGIGMAIAGVDRVWLLAGLTFLLSMIPFVGAAGVWVPVSLGLALSGEVLAGVLLAVYGLTIVSTSDNLIRALVLSESAQMHPLLALLSALGALQVVGLWGIFLGPVVAAFFYSLLKILHDRMQGIQPPPPHSEAY